MKGQTKQIAAVLLVLAAVLISGCTDQISEMSADEIASMMEAKQAEITDFSATVITTVSYNGEVAMERALVLNKAPDKSRMEYTDPAEVAGVVMVTNGSTMWTYDPAKNRVTKMELPDMGDGTSEMEYTQIVKGILDETDISLEGIETIDSRSAYLLNATPKDGVEIGPITRMRVWIDRENWMLLRMDMYTNDGNLISKVEYRNVTFNTGIPDSAFIFETPVGAEVVETSLEDMIPKEMTLEAARANITFDLKTPAYLPEGYEFEHAMVYGDFFGDGREMVSLHYIDGPGILRLTEWVSDDSDRFESMMGDPVTVSINGTGGVFRSLPDMNTLRWSADGIGYSLSGAIGKEELVKVAESLV